MKKRILLGHVFLFSIIFCSSQTWIEKNKVVASDRAAFDWFGTVAISGDFALVGAIIEEEDTSGGNTLENAGSAYLYERNGIGNWTESQKLVSSDRAMHDEFGRAVAISDNYLIVGAWRDDEDELGSNYINGTGSAYLFEKEESGKWIEVQKIVASDRQELDLFAWAVAISGDYAIVGAYQNDEDVSGGNYLFFAGAAYIFERDSSGSWNEVQKLVASDRGLDDRFGYSVAISGNHAIVGAQFDNENSTGGDTLNNAGSSYIFERDSSGIWNEVQKIVAPDREIKDCFGASVSIDEDFAIVGAKYEGFPSGGTNPLQRVGAAYIFERDVNGTWTYTEKLIASDREPDDHFGQFVSISGNYALVGALSDDEDELGGNTMHSSGSAYIFERNSNGVWSQYQKIVASDRAAGDGFGFVGIDGNHAIVGAHTEDEDVYGGNTLQDAGSAYIFEFCTHTSNAISINTCDSYLSPSGNHIWTTNGTYLDTISNTVGCDSIITINVSINSTQATINPIVCDSYFSPSSNYLWTSSGTYTDTIPNSVGCDSSITINLTVKTVDTTVSQTGLTLTANSSNAFYQWLDCNNGGIIIAGATNQSYTPLTNGLYAVEITENGCIDTSDCYSIQTVNIGKELEKSIKVYPNPTTGVIQIDFEEPTSNTTVILRNTLGQILLKQTKRNVKQFDLEIDGPKGIYFLEIQASEDEFITFKIVKE